MSDSDTFEAYASKAYTVFTWKIHGWSWISKKGVYTDSPPFFTADGGEWAVSLYPSGVNYLCCLYRRYNNKAPLVLHYDVDFLPKLGDGPPSFSVKAEPFGINHFLRIPPEVFSLRTAISDFLVLQFRLKKCRRKGARGLFVVSEIQVERSSLGYSCSFEEATRTRLVVDNEAQSLMENDRNIVRGRFSNQEEEASGEIFPVKIRFCGLGYAVVTLNRSRTQTWGQSRIHLLDINGRVHMSSDVGEHFFQTEFMDVFRYRKLFTAEQMECDEKYLCRDGQLDFILEIETSNGKLSSEFCKTIYSPSRSRSHNTLKEDIIGLFSDLKKPDLQIRIGNKVFHAHWAILRARSKFFYAMRKSNMLETKTGIVDLKDTDPKAFRHVMNFIYTATFNRDIDLEGITNLYVVADRFAFDSLKRICSSILKSRITPDNCCCLLAFSDFHHDDNLKHIVEFFFHTHYDYATYSWDWHILKDQHPEIAENIQKKYWQWRRDFYLYYEFDPELL